MPSSSSHSNGRSSRMPSQPRCPTYGGTKNRWGSPATSACCIPSGAAHQIAKRPSPWWFVSTMRKARLPRTKNVGAPWLSRSLVSGSAKQIPRIRFNARSRSADETTDVMVARGSARDEGVPQERQHPDAAQVGVDLRRHEDEEQGEERGREGVAPVDHE